MDRVVGVRLVGLRDDLGDVFGSGVKDHVGLGSIFDLVLPPVDASDGRDNVAARCQALLDQVACVFGQPFDVGTGS